jgi:hypothetical protein
VVGYEAPANSVVHQAFLWTAAGGKMYLASIPGAFAQTPTALNNAGEVAGEALLSAGVRHAFQTLCLLRRHT